MNLIVLQRRAAIARRIAEIDEELQTERYAPHVDALLDERLALVDARAALALPQAA
jgi:hypothetical protein